MYLPSLQPRSSRPFTSGARVARSELAEVLQLELTVWWVCMTALTLEEGDIIMKPSPMPEGGMFCMGSS